MLPHQAGANHHDFTSISLVTGFGILFGIYISEIAEGKLLGGPFNLTHICSRHSILNGNIFFLSFPGIQNEICPHYLKHSLRNYLFTISTTAVLLVAIQA